MKQVLSRASWRAGAAIGCLAVAGFAFAGVTPAVPQVVPHLVLTAGTDFTVTGVITDSSCTGTPVDLYPGASDCLTYSVHNPLSATIAVTSLSVSVDGASLPANCPASLLDLGSAAYSGTPALTVGAGQDGQVTEPISMGNNGNQDNCAGATFTLVYSGTAQYTDSTSTALGSSANPSTFGSLVTFTATVTATNASSDPYGPLSSGETGDQVVNFYSCTSSACTTTTLLGPGTVNTSTGQASYSSSGLPVGTSYIEAVYGGSGTNFDFTGSTSNVVSQVVNAATTPSSQPLLPPPPPPAGATSSASAQSDCSTGLAVATLGGITASGNCDGALTLALYGSDPVGPATFSGGVYFDLKIAAGSTFDTVTLTDRALNGGTTLYYWTGTAWAVVSPQTFTAGPPPSITAVLSAASTPNLASLVGTVFATGTPGVPTTTTTAPPVSPGGGTTTSTAPPTSASGATTTAPPTKAAGGMAFTGANITRIVVGGLALLMAGFLVLGLARRRLRLQGSGDR